MIDFIWGLIVGVFIGSTLGIVVAALGIISAQSDRDALRHLEDLDE